MRGGGDPSATAGAGGASVPACPYCGSEDTEREHGKGPSLCRSINYCNACGELFEAFG